MNEDRPLKTFYRIYVLVSGGIDSTFLYEKLKKKYGRKVYPINCFNPYEQSKTLDIIAKDPNFRLIKPKELINYGEILKEAFLKLPEARKLKSEGKYHKKIFGCCYYIKHKGFLQKKMFKHPNCVIVSGIKKGDSHQRWFWLDKLAKNNSFFHRHLTGQLYCYPFRDYTYRELPDIVVKRLRKKYPDIKHSGCEICPVIVLYDIKDDKDKYKKSIAFAKKLGVYKKNKI